MRAERRHALLVEPLEQLRPGQRAGGEELEGGRPDRLGGLEVAALLHQGVEAAAVSRPGQGVDPGEVVGGEQVDGAADRPGPDQLGAGEIGGHGARDSDADGEPGGAEVLGLDPEDGAGGLGGVGGAVSGTSRCAASRRRRRLSSRSTGTGRS